MRKKKVKQMWVDPTFHRVIKSTSVDTDRQIGDITKDLANDDGFLDLIGYKKKRGRGNYDFFK